MFGRCIKRAAFGLILLATPASADRYEIPGTSWNLRVSDDLDLCTIGADYEGGYSMMIGMTKNWTGLLALSNPQWAVPASLRLTFVFSNGQRFSGTFNRGKKDVLISPPISNVDFIKSIADAFSVNIYMDGRRVTGLSLKGTKIAIGTLADCVRALTAAREPDPLMEKPSKPMTPTSRDLRM